MRRAESLALTGAPRAQWFGVAPRDVWTLAGAAVLLAIVGLIASLIPARRIERSNAALRSS